MGPPSNQRGSPKCVDQPNVDRNERGCGQSVKDSGRNTLPPTNLFRNVSPRSFTGLKCRRMTPSSPRNCIGAVGPARLADSPEVGTEATRLCWALRPASRCGLGDAAADRASRPPAFGCKRLSYSPRIKDQASMKEFQPLNDICSGTQHASLRLVPHAELSAVSDLRGGM